MSSSQNVLTIAELDQFEREMRAAMEKASSAADLELLRRDYLGKEGTIKALFGRLKDLSPEEKPTIAGAVSRIREQLEGFLRTRAEAAARDQEREALSREFLDLSLPGRTPGLGRIHAITDVERRIAELLKPFGFQSVQGPEIETEYYCFDSLNIPKHHPARDMQDTFFTQELPEGGSGSSLMHLLRTHTTSVQSRTLQKGGLPVKIASFGRVYRNETEDASHQAMFHQFELVWLQEGLTVSHLMSLIQHILKGLYGKRRKIRFVPKFYPYTEPSIGPQIDCTLCGGKGCSSCGGAGWVTIAGAGMVHRNVLAEFKYDPEKVTGFAFGLGTSRLACQLCGIPNMKMAYENDLRVYRALP